MDIKHDLTENEAAALAAFQNDLLARLPKQVAAIILFGSKARGESRGDSDVDLMVVVDEETLDVWDAVQSISSAVSLRLDVFLSVKVVGSAHLDYLKQVKSPFIKNVLKDGATLWRAA